ncbi:glycosyltransferase [Granulicella sibirica]|uniref:Putative glycosyltransferase n=1 Tax=Granulicella sibirica TaxID=2479048 RepID=A0A4Q0SWF9_9BACT|nr:glycosyltransferase [Granulicella sibirica]RXH54762.1 putative glycosyltransferase [Granulicella sibirica]
MPVPMVSVSMTAYNSEAWLARALDSVLRQQTSFAFEIVIGDDCSKDQTLAVARSYQERYPDVVRVLERAKNLGMQRNFYDTFENCRGKYIAWLDADDYWTDPEKMAIQVNLLESDQTVSACGHYVRQVTSTGEVLHKKSPFVPAGRYGLERIIRSNFVPSPTIMFRNGLHHKLPSWFFDLTGLADWPILLMAGVSGDIILIDRVMADYVLTPGSAYMSKNALHQDLIDLEFCERMESILPDEWHRSVRASKGRRYGQIAYLYLKQKNYPAAREMARKAFRAPNVLDNIVSKTKMLALATVCDTLWKTRRAVPRL